MKDWVCTLHILRKQVALAEMRMSAILFQVPKTTHGMARQDSLYPSIFLQWEGHHLHRQIFGVACKLAQGVEIAVLISTFFTGVLTTAMPLQQSPTMPVCNAPDFVDINICLVALGRRACKSTRVQQGLQKLTGLMLNRTVAMLVQDCISEVFCA